MGLFGKKKKKPQRPPHQQHRGPPRHGPGHPPPARPPAAPPAPPREEEKPAPPAPPDEEVQMPVEEPTPEPAQEPVRETDVEEPAHETGVEEPVPENDFEEPAHKTGVEEPVPEPEEVVVSPEAETMSPDAEPAPPAPQSENVSPEEMKKNQIEDLMTLDGVGRKRAEKLWDAGFRSAAEVADATLEELASVEGFSKKLAEAVKVSFDEEFDDEVEAASELDSSVESEVVSAPSQETGTEGDVSARLLAWSVDGFDVAFLESVPADERDDNFVALYNKTAKAIDEIEAIRDELAEMNILGLEGDVDRLIALLNYPQRVDEIKAMFSALKGHAASRNVRYEIAHLAEIESLAPQVNKVLAKLDAGQYDETVKIEIADIKRAYKEDFFLSQMAEQISAAPPMEVKKATALTKVIETPVAEKKPMHVEDLFLLHKEDYRLIHHLTNRTIGDQEKQEVFTELKALRSFVRNNERFKPDELNIIKFGDKIALLQQGDQTLLTVVVRGDVNIWAKKLIGKVLAMIEKDEIQALKGWDGDASKLPGAKKNMTALMYACVRLGEQKAE
ncbi:MAG: helix-hairpin-helix domain-containing protein [Candidatus Thermoplasmatota archaeon]|nr:helix-hairpin-helix domain-containing protein [Candidatus Thermoplasmatota archaeon]